METTTISAIEVKKELYKKKDLTAKFYHFDNHKLYYTIELESGKYMFPISVVDNRTIKIAADKTDIAVADAKFSAIDASEIKNENVVLTVESERAAADVRGAIFGLEVKASELNRWIERAIKNDDFAKIG